jgi:hypothetical protein
VFCGRAAVDGTERANEFHQTCRGNGDGKQAKLTSSNTGSPNGARNLNFKTSSCTGPLDSLMAGGTVVVSPGPLYSSQGFPVRSHPA